MGLADLAYVDLDRVFVWFNCGGNAWSVDPIEVHGTPLPGPFDTVRIIDLYGNGTGGILFSSAADRQGRATMYFLDLTGGIKPYLLTEVDNNLGATTRVEYLPSTHFYLEDEKARAPWRTPLPFPVQTVARVEVVDRLSHGKLTTEFSYHHGYWDGAEREFRGFGMVEQFDTETFEDYHAANGSAAVFVSVAPKYFSPPTLTRNWFHQGPVGEEFGDWAEQDYSNEFWSGDPPLVQHRETVDAFLRALPSRPARRDALRALRGSRLRTELYALDGSPYEHRPYSVVESAYGLREESPPSSSQADRRRIFFAFPTIQRATQWERGDDPLTVVALTGDYDAIGQSRQETSVAMPRRSAKRRTVEGTVVGVVQPDETGALVTHVLTRRAQPDPALANVPGGLYLYDRVWQTHGFEAATKPTVTETDPAAVLQVLADQCALARRLHEGYVATLSAWTPGSAPPAALALVAHTVNHFDGPAFAGRDDGRLVYGALTRSETLVFTPALLDAAYADGAGSRRPAYLEGTAPLPPGAPANFGSALGYQRRTAAPYQNGWYADTQRQQFDFQTTGTPPPGWTAWPARGQAVAGQDAIGRQTALVFDRYWLLPVATIDAAGLQVSASYNLRVMQPEAVDDVNGNTTRIRFGTYGQPVRSWLESREDANHERTGGSEAKPELTWRYDLLAYQRTRTSSSPQPASTTTIQRVFHASDQISDETVTAVEFTNGFGRVIQKRAQAEDRVFGASGDDVGLPAEPGSTPVAARSSAAQDRVVVSGWQVYNNKGLIVEKWDPFLSNGWEYEPEEDAKRGGHRETYYDPRGQVIRTLNGDGSQERVAYGRPKRPTELEIGVQDLDSVPEAFEPTPWELYAYDANDLAPVSTASDGQSLAARAPAIDHFTPANTVLDAKGRAICQVRRGGTVPSTDWLITRSAYDIRGNLIEFTDALGRPAFRYGFDFLDRSLRVAGIDGGLRTSVLDALSNIVHYRDSRGAIALRTYDVLNREVEIWARNDSSANRVTLRERVVFGDGGSATQSQAARDAARAIDALGKPVEHWDEAGVLRFRRYDFKGNVLSKSRQVVSDAVLAALPTDAPWVSDWSQPNSGAVLDGFEYVTDVEFDALDRPVAVTCPLDVDGRHRVIRPTHNRGGGLESVTVFDSATATAGDDHVVFVGYNARGQRVLVVRGNGTMTRYAYDPDTLRLARVRTELVATPRVADKWDATGDPLQDCTYTYDLVGNIVSVDERVPGCGVDNSPNGRDRLLREFTYDALGRLTSATGRACIDQSPSLIDGPNCGSYDAPVAPGAAAPTQANAPMRTERYRQSFSYDPAGNLLKVDYNALRTPGMVRLWARRSGFGGTAPGQWRLAPNNRLTTLTAGGTTFTLTFDPNGNLVQQNLETFHLWDHADRMVGYRVQNGGAPSILARYLYDAAGLRVKKWVHTSARDESTVYADALCEHHRSDAIPVTGENNTLHISDGEDRLATVRLGRAHPSDAGPAVAYYVGDHLKSSVVVIDDSGTWINREEFFPYGETSFGSFSRKRYRFAGKERDAESGASYQGARYYMPGFARWMSCDPLGLKAGSNPFVYCSCNPVCRWDPEGALDAPSPAASTVDDSDNVGVTAPALARAEERLSNARLAFAKGVGAALLEYDINQAKSTIMPVGLPDVVPNLTIGDYDRAERGEHSWNPLEQALNEFSVADDFAGKGFQLLKEGRDAEANQAFGNAGYWYGKTFVSCVNLGSIVAMAPGLVKAGGTLALQGISRLPRFTGGRLTPFSHLRRFFIQDTMRYPGVGTSWGGRLLQRLFPNVEWQQGHVLIQQKWFRVNGPSQLFPSNAAANTGLQRLGNADWNLIPMPRGFNNWLGSSPRATALVAATTYTVVGGELYWAGGQVKELADRITSDDD